MTVIFSKKCEYGLQAILYIAAHPPGETIPAEKISQALKIPREFVSKILQDLKVSGLIGSVKGKAGGFFLGKEPSQIKLIDIVEAIDGLEMFNSCVLGFPECSPEAPCPVHNKWGALRDQAYQMLKAETLDQLKERTLAKISKL
jgi:Rrf2 family protein